jgi:hypothetical protein
VWQSVNDPMCIFVSVAALRNDKKIPVIGRIYFFDHAVKTKMFAHIMGFGAKRAMERGIARNILSRIQCTGSVHVRLRGF